jgi:hypothetical protein
MSRNKLRIRTGLFLITNFHRVLNVVSFLQDNSLVSEFYMPTFQNTLSHLQTECSETLAYKIQSPGNYPEESIQQTQIRNIGI